MDTDQSIDTGMEGQTELRVHGVSGTEPEDFLDHPLLKNIEGDERAGFYRRWYPGGRSADLDASRRLEGYRWGNLTSGYVARAAWLLLLPFMLANVAHWMLPNFSSAGRTARIAGSVAAAALRLFALSLTVLFVLTATQVAVDLAGWQCGGYSRCASSTWLLDPISDGWGAEPGVRVVVTAIVPGLVVLGIGLLGRRNIRLPSPIRRNGADEDRAPMSGQRFWGGDPSARMARAAHVAAAAGCLASLIAWPVTTLATTGVSTMIGAILCVTGLAIAATAAVLVASGSTGRRAGYVRAAVHARRAALVLLVLAAVFSMLDHGPWADAGHLPGVRTAVTMTIGAAMALVVVLAVAVAIQRPWQRAADGFRPGMRGFAAPAVCAVSALIAAAFSAGLSYRAAGLLGYPVIQQSTATDAIRGTRSVVNDESLTFQARQTAAEAPTPLVLPSSFAWAGAATTLIVLAALVVLAVVAVGAVRRIGPAEAQVRQDHDVPPSENPEAVRRIATAIVLASLVDGVGRIVGRITLAAAVIVLCGLVLATTLPGAGHHLEQAPLSTVSDFGTWLIGIFAVGLIGLAWQSTRSPELRRTIGALWDVGSFWPRAAHPMAPASYGERAVPELVDRITTLATSTPGAHVIVSAHSQGSILAAAAVLQLPDEAADRVSLVTHGSPLRHLYARFFPAYLGPDSLWTIRHHTGGRWRNLYRDTDPVGSWVLDPHATGEQRVDHQLVDPHTLDQPIRGHEEYWNDPAYERVVTRVIPAEPG